jgi:hypothetical protein
LNWSANTSRGRRLWSISVRAWRTPRWTVTAASNWLSLLSRLTSDRFSPRLMVVGPGVPVGVAQLAAEPTASPAPRSRLDRSIVRRENCCSKSGLVTIDLRRCDCGHIGLYADLLKTRNSWMDSCAEHAKMPL